MSTSSRDIASTATQNVALAGNLYRDAPLLPRLLMRNRPLICPFESITPFVPDGAAILDIGCGGGLLLGLLAMTRRRIRGYGTDASGKAIEVARGMAAVARAQGSDAVLEFAEVDAADALPQGPFDVVSLIDVAHHIQPHALRSVLNAAASRVTPDGGVLIYKDMVSRPLWRAGANRLHDLVIARQWIHYVPVDLVKKSAEGSGLSLVHAETLNRYWYGHELLVFRRGYGRPHQTLVS